MKIVFFDFDGTLSDSPTPDDGKVYYEKIKGTPYPHIGWWGKPESLDDEIFDIKYNVDVYNFYKKLKTEKDTLLYLLTNRIDKLSNEIELLLNKWGVELDGLSYKNDKRTKSERIANIISEYENVDEIIVLDDDVAIIDEFKILRNELNTRNIKTTIYKIMNGVRYLVESQGIYNKLTLMENKSAYMKTKPMWLPQLSAPYNYLVSSLDKDGIPYSMGGCKPSQFKPLKGAVDTSIVDGIHTTLKNTGKIDPIFIASNNEILDGLNRVMASNNYNPNYDVQYIKIELPYLDASRMLNKIQDIYDYEMEQNVNKNVKTVSLSLEDINRIGTLKKQYKMKLFRKSDIIEDSPSGNFFNIRRTKNDTLTFDIEFDNLLDLAIENSVINTAKELPLYFLNIVLPDIDFESRYNYLVEKNDLSIDFNTFINRVVVMVLKQNDIDGIKYGEYIVQSI
jgi:hypothetical protein